MSGDKNKLSKDFQFLFHYMIHCGVCGFTWKDEVLTTYYVCCMCIMLNSMVMVKLELLLGGWGDRRSFMNGVFPLHACHTFNPLNAELNPICQLLALLETHPLLHVSRIRVKQLKTNFFFLVTYLLFCLFYKVTVFWINFNSCRGLVYMFMNLVIFSYGRAMPPENYC